MGGRCGVSGVERGGLGGRSGRWCDGSSNGKGG